MTQFEIFAESKEFDNEYLVTPQAVIAIWKATCLTGCLKPQYLYIRIGMVDLEKIEFYSYHHVFDTRIDPVT